MLIGRLAPVSGIERTRRNPYSRDYVERAGPRTSAGGKLVGGHSQNPDTRGPFCTRVTEVGAAQSSSRQPGKTNSGQGVGSRITSVAVTIVQHGIRPYRELALR